MAASLFDRAFALLFGRDRPERPDEDQALVAELTDAIVDTVEPRVRAQRRYRKQLEPCVRIAIAYLRRLGDTPLEPLLLSRGNWSREPALTAFFARAEDIPELLGRSKDLRAFFEHHDAQEAVALLGMRQEEKTVFAPRYHGGHMMEEVTQTTVSFTGHRLFAPSATAQETRLEVGRRIMLRLAQVALGRILEIDQRGLKHEQHKAWLSTRLRFLQLAQDGMQGIVDDPATIAQQIEDVKRQRDAAVRDYIEVKSTLATLDGYIAQIEEVFGHPERHVALTRSPLFVDRMNVKQGAGEGQPAITLAQLRIGDRPQAVVAFVRCLRAEVPARADLLAQAERFL